MSGEQNSMDVLLSNLLMADKVTVMWHWKVKSLSQHLALAELHEALDDLTDELAKIYMGIYGTDGHIELSDPNFFNDKDVVAFIIQLCDYLADAKGSLPVDGSIIDKFEELQAACAKVRYKIENLTEAINESKEDERKREIYVRWKKLVNMSATSVKNFKEKQTALARKNDKHYPGLKPAKAKQLGISSGVQSAEWIIKMKSTPVKEWTPEMWKWASKQISFISRMSGNKGPLYDDKGNPTRKLLSLKIWGHNPGK